MKVEQASICDMTTTATEFNSTDISQCLPWLVDMGADEVLLHEGVNRFASPVQSPTQRPAEVQPELKTRVPLVAAPPKPAVNWKAVAAGAEGVAAAEALAASITSLDAYRDALDNFDTHPLKKTAVRTCGFSGAMQARVLVLVDKPRNEEDRSGEILSGNHLVLAERMLAAIKLKALDQRDADEAVSLASFIPWRPPGNRAPLELEARMCVPLAARLISLLQPQLILCFGHLPAQWLANGEDAVFKSRGKWVDHAGIPMMTTFHPETLLNSPASKRLAWHDLQAFRQKLDDLP